MTRVVIVGTGPCGMEAALGARRRDPSAEITVVSEETDRPIARTALMYVLAGQLDAAGICPYPRDVFDGAGLRFLRCRAAAVGDHVLQLADGRSLPFDRLLLATGSVARAPPWPGATLPGVGHFVTAQDLDWLCAELHGDAPRFPGLGAGPYLGAAVRGGPCRSPVVIGGGLIGIEVVETLLAAGRRPVFLLRDDAFWPVALDAHESTFIVDRLRAHGVDVRTGVTVTGLHGDAVGVRSVVTDAGPVHADCVVVAIGVRPNTAWLEGQVGLDAATGGVVVDAGLRTDRPDVFAAGDCAAVRWSDGSVRPELLWYTAKAQGAVAARVLTGDATATYVRGVWTNAAKLMDVEYYTAGRCLGTPAWRHDEVGAVRSTIRVHAHDGRVVGLSALGRRWQVATWVRWIEEGRRLDWVRAHLATSSFDTEFVPAWAGGS